MGNDSASMLSGITVCIAEDRASCEPALRILVASLTRRSPGIRALLFCPNATPSFAKWISDFPHCSLNPCALDGVWTKYDIKPLALLTALRTGADDVLWIDSDVLIARDFRPVFAELSVETLAVTEEALSGGRADPDGMRARMWGMPVGRSLPFTANTGVIRVTTAHIELLEAWHDLLQSPEYRAAQAAPWYERESHLAGDQEVLTALLSSSRFSDIPIRFLRRGPDIVQFFGTSGYTVAERIGHLRTGLPYFIHSQGFRPWWPNDEPVVGWSARFRALYNDMSPYTTLARGYASSLDCDRWLSSQSKHGRALAALTPDNAPLTGLPLALISDTVRIAKTVSGRWKNRLGARQP
jgi:hypothetical protein